MNSNIISRNTIVDKNKYKVVISVCMSDHNSLTP